MAHPVIQLAAIAIGPDGRELEVFARRIAFDEARADPQALKLNHYDRDLWQREAVPEPVVVTDFAAFLKRHSSVGLVSKRTGNPYKVARIAGHNTAFDIDRVKAMFDRYRAFLAVDFRTALDTRYGAIWFFEMHPELEPPKDYKLTTLCEHFGIATEGAHDALFDVRLSIALAREITKRWQAPRSEVA